MQPINYESRMGELLRFHGIRGTGVEAVKAFQASKGMTADGVVGTETAWALQEPWAHANVLGFVRVPADIFPGRGGYNRLTLRADVAARWNQLRDEVIRLGGIATTAGGRRRLQDADNDRRVSKSMHIPAIAFDLSTETGMRDPAVDPFIITHDGEYWRVWFRGRGETRTLDAVTWHSGEERLVRFTAPVVDFTAIAERYGFQRIRPHSNFPSRYMSAEWWHFQCTGPLGVLVPGLSQFGAECFRAGITSDELQQFPQWEKRKSVYREDWF